jgi:hypothetical protein
VRNQSFWSWMALALLAGTSSCAHSPGRFDLLPSVPPGSPNNQTGYCIDNERVGVVVRNLGSTGVPSVDVKIVFSYRGTTDTQTQTTGPIQGGQASGVLEFSIPQGCFDQDCNFTISVDPENKYPNEASEQNNTVDGVCVG